MPPAAPDIATQSSGFTSSRSSGTGTGSFHATLHDLLPIDDSTEEKRPADKNRDEAKIAPPGLVLPTPMPETLPFQFALPPQSIEASLETQAGTRTSTKSTAAAATPTDGVSTTKSRFLDMLARATATTTVVGSGDKADLAQTRPLVGSGKAKAGAAGSTAADVPIQSGESKADPKTQIVIADSTVPDPADKGYRSAEVAHSTSHLPNSDSNQRARGLAESATEISQPRIAAADAGEGAATNLAFTARITSADLPPSPETVSRVFYLSSAPALPATKAAPGSATEQAGEPAPASSPTSQSAAAQHAEQGHTSDRRDQNNAQGGPVPDKDDFAKLAREQSVHVDTTAEGRASPIPFVGLGSDGREVRVVPARFTSADGRCPARGAGR